MKLVCIKKLDAGIAVELLKGNGIEAQLSSDDCGSQRPALAFTQGVGVLINEKYKEKAIEILKVLE